MADNKKYFQTTFKNLSEQDKLKHREIIDWYNTLSEDRQCVMYRKYIDKDCDIDCFCDPNIYEIIEIYKKEFNISFVIN